LTFQAAKVNATSKEQPTWRLSPPVHVTAAKGMHRTGCSGETRLVLHVPSSS